MKFLYITDLDGTLVRSVFSSQQGFELNDRLLATLKLLKPHANIALVTSASRKTCLAVLESVGLLHFFDHIVTANDVDFIKPHPEGYEICMAYFDASPEQTFVFEDTKSGLEAARATGAHVCLVTW